MPMPSRLAAAPWHLRSRLAEATPQPRHPGRPAAGRPKAARRREPPGPQQALVDSMATLGHAPRPHGEATARADTGLSPHAG